jgi:hypothetical protein
MTILYQPPIASLGIMAPLLGPWFSGGAAMPQIPALPMTGALPTQLHVQITLNGDWLPPATGNLSLYLIKNSVVPPALDCLRNVNGLNPFEAGGLYGGNSRLVAYFQLLPEVELRLHQCMALMPAATSAPLAAAPVAGTPTRPQVHSFMLVFPNNTTYTVGFIDNLFSGMLDLDASATERPNCVGLVSDGTNITGNMALPMTHLRRPGGSAPDKLLNNVPNVALDLWCFDRRGRPIDPGAVACWWSWLLNYGIGEDPAGSGTFQLMAPDTASGMATPGTVPAGPGAPASAPQVANFAAGLTAHLVDPHEGPLGAPFVSVDRDTSDTNNVRRLTASAGGSAVTPVAGTALVGGAAAGNIVLGLTAAPTASFPAPAAGDPNLPFNPAADNAPLARIALLPAGSYGAGPLTLWPGGALHTNLTRDFVRVAVVDEEAFLIGVRRRRSEAGAPTPAFPDAGTALPIALRREMDQNRPSTRITVGSTAGPVLRATSGPLAAAMLALPTTAANPARLVLGVTDSAWGGPSAPAGMVAPVAAAASPFPDNLALSSTTVAQPLPAGQYRVLALQGDGGDAGDRQMVLVQINFGATPSCVGATVRVWPLGFSFGTGDHVRLSGGFGTVGANNIAALVMTLPAGLIDPLGTMHADMLLTFPNAAGGAFQRRYAHRPFDRPSPVNGVAVGANPTAQDWVICETGVTGPAGNLPAGSVPAGAHVVELGSTPKLVDRTTIPAAAWVGTLYNYLTTGPTALVSLTEPAFQSTPDRADAVGRALPRQAANPGGSGNQPPGLNGPGGGVGGLIGNRLHQLGRTIGDSASASLPLGLMDRKEVAGASLAGPGQAAVIGSAPPVPWALEPAANHFLAFPGVPASIETHGAGAVLSGAAAIAAYEYVRERTAGLGVAALQGIGNAQQRSMVFQSELALVIEASMNLLPAAVAPAAPSPVAAVLRTSAVGVEGLPLVCKAIVDNGYYPTMTKVLDDFYVWANGAIPVPFAIPGGPTAGQVGTWLSNQSPPASNALAATRALDRRIQSSAYGSREALNALIAAIGRAQDLVYIETPELDNLAIESGDGKPAQAENLAWWQTLIDRMTACIGLRVVLCVPTLPAQGSPDKLRQVRDQCLLAALAAMRAAHLGRFAVFSPGVGGGRSLRLASTSVVIDDAWALTGSTHLSRRGLSWDSSVAAVVFDENLTGGRPTDVLNFRNALLADRLGIPLAAVPFDPSELVRAINDLDAHGSSRLSAGAIVPPPTPIGSTDVNVWNPDGSRAWATMNTGDFAELFAAALELTDVAHAMVEG